MTTPFEAKAYAEAEIYEAVVTHGLASFSFGTGNAETALAFISDYILEGWVPFGVTETSKRRTYHFWRSP